MTTSHSSLISTFTQVSAMIFCIVSPHFQIIFLISSLSTINEIKVGAYCDSLFGFVIADSMQSKTCILHFFACSNATLNISIGIQVSLMSICIAVIPSLVQVTLKSISQPKSSSSCKSVSTLYSHVSESVISHIAIQATGALIGTQASIRANVDHVAAAIDDDQFDANISVTTLITYGKSTASGSTGIRARSANAQCPISLLPVKSLLDTSHTENGGKL